MEIAFTGAYETADPVTVTIGGIPAQVLWAGLAWARTLPDQCDRAAAPGRGLTVAGAPSPEHTVEDQRVAEDFRLNTLNSGALKSGTSVQPSTSIPADFAGTEQRPEASPPPMRPRAIP